MHNFHLLCNKLLYFPHSQSKFSSLDFHIFLEESNFRFRLRSAERQRKRANVASSSSFVRKCSCYFHPSFNPEEDDHCWERVCAKSHLKFIFFLREEIQLLFSIPKIMMGSVVIGQNDIQLGAKKYLFRCLDSIPTHPGLPEGQVM